MARDLVLGRVSAEAIDRVLSARYEYPRDLTAGEWVDEFRRVDRMLEDAGTVVTRDDSGKPPAGR